MNARLAARLSKPRGLSCTAWRQPRRHVGKAIVLFVGLCMVLAFVVLGWSLAHSILTGAAAMGCCVPLGDFV